MTRVVHTRWLVWVYGVALTPNLILIRTDCRDDAALLAHEQKHCNQMRAEGTARFWWRYVTSRTHRQRYEVEAYRVSVVYRPGCIDRYARALASNYLLPLTFDEAKRLLAA